jgi:hypothetical protein
MIDAAVAGPEGASFNVGGFGGLQSFENPDIPKD